MATNQPDWQVIAQLGDASPVDYGGYWILRDRTGVYAPEGRYLVSPDDDGAPEGWQLYRFSLDRCKVVDGYLVPFGYDAATYPHPVSAYEEWFADDLAGIAACCDYPGGADGLRADLCAEDAIRRAWAYRAIGEYHGMGDLDHYPDTWQGETGREELETLLAKWGFDA